MMTVGLRLNGLVRPHPLNDPVWDELDEIGFYEHRLGDFPTWERVCREKGYRCVVETGAINEWEQDIGWFIKLMSKFPEGWGVTVDQTRRKVKYITVPSTGRPLGWSIEETADRVAPFYHAAASQGRRVVVAEPWPRLDWERELEPYLNALVARGCQFDRFDLDVNLTAIDDRAPSLSFWDQLLGRTLNRSAYDARRTAEIQAMADWCHVAGKKFGVILGSPVYRGTPATNEGAIRSFEHQENWVFQRVQPDHVTVQWWEDPKNWPNRPTSMHLATRMLDHARGRAA